MADVEGATPLLSNDIPPVSETVKRLTYAAAAVVGIVAIVNCFGHGWGGFFGNVVLVALSLFFAYRILTIVIENRVASGELAPGASYAYLACGLVPAPLAIVVAQVIFSIIFGLLIILFLNVAKPAWLTDISNASSALGGHGELLVDGQRFSDGRTFFARKFAKHAAHTAHHAIPHASRVLSHTVRAFVNSPRSIAAIRAEETYTMPKFTFQDGTNASPLIASFITALSRISTLFVLILLLVNAFVIKAFPQEWTKKFIAERFALRRDGPTMRSVTSSTMAVGLGLTLLAFIWSGATGIIPGIISALFFWVVARVNVATAELIGLRVYSNDRTTIPENKKPVLILPITLIGAIVFVWSLGILLFLKSTLPNIAMMFANGQTTTQQLARGFSWMIPYIVINAIVTIAISVYACRLAFKRYSEETSVF